ncbi:MAG TPA: hypothetical protein VIS47_04725 [Nitrosopumilus sp.]
MQIVEIKQAGEILPATSAKNHYTKLIARQRHLIVNVIKSMNRHGHKKRLPPQAKIYSDQIFF